ncbi:MAG: peptidylprolyl isomerase [Sphingomonadaceae bacterium]
MQKRFLLAGALAALALSPFSANAQDAAEPPVSPAPAAPEVPVSEPAQPAAPKTYAAVDFNPQNDPENILLLDLSNRQRVAIRLMPDWAPSHVERIKLLARQGFYNGVIFHRVIEGFMAQTGDPTGTGTGGSPLPDLHEEFNPMPHLRGTVSMARAQDDNSANSQFFIVFYPRMSLDKHYTNFGRVISGMAAVDSIQRGEPPANPTRIVQASLASDNKAPPSPSAIAPSAITADMLSAPQQ